MHATRATLLGVSLGLSAVLAAEAEVLSLGGRYQVNSYTIGVQAQSIAAVDSLGNFVVACTSYRDGSSGGIFGQRYASGGAALGNEFQINTYTRSVQTASSLAMDG